LGDLRGMKAVVDRFGAQPLAYIVLEGMALGHIYHRGLGVQRYQITCSAAGGHSWMNYGRPSAIHELAALVGRLTALPLPATPRTTMNVGIFQGGTSVNTIAAEAHLELDLRSEDEQTLTALAGQVEKLVEAANVAPESAAAEEDRLRMSACIIGKRPAGGIPLDHPLLTLACCCLEGQGLTSSVGVGSTDANVPLSRGLPAVTIGLTYGGGAHTLHEFIQTGPLAQGLGQIFDLVESAYRL
jgi:di/tripeptidase